MIWLSRQRLLAAALSFLPAWLAGLQAAETRSSTLMIVLDAVPYSLVQEITVPENGLFRDFKGPVPLISTFPSNTSVALGGMLGPFGLARSPGYEARFFDWSRRRVRGGGVVSYFKIEFAWREFFDWNRKGPVGSMVEAVRPVRSGIKRLRRAIDAFVESDRAFYSIYIAATDAAAHVRSPAALEVLFEKLDAMIVSARERRPERPFDVVIFSDHGMAGGEPLKNVWRALRRALREAGFRYAHRLRRPRDVVLTPFGLVSSLEAYTEEARKVEVAALLAEVTGVDLCVVESEEGWTIASARGRAKIQRRSSPQGTDWRYEPLDGDPLGYAKLVAVSGDDRSSGWLADAKWFEATALGRYPDALHRLAKGFDLVENPASILCSMSSGYMFGSRKTEMLARIGKGRLRWTHGALEREATLGFLMSDAPHWQPSAAARFDRALLPFLASAGPRPTQEAGRGVGAGSPPVPVETLKLPERRPTRFPSAQENG